MLALRFVCSAGTKFAERGYCYAGPAAWKRKGKGKEEYLYSAFLHQGTHKALMARITQFYLQTTPCLLRKRSPDGATTTEAADIQLQLTTHLSTPKG